MDTVDVVVPMPNDKRALSGYLKMFGSFLDDQSLVQGTITIADKASTDSAWRVECARSHPRVVGASAPLLLPHTRVLTAGQLDREGVA